MTALDEKVLETCSQMDLLLCHLLQRLIDLSGGLVLEDELSIRRKRKAKTRFEDVLKCVPIVRMRLRELLVVLSM